MTGGSSNEHNTDNPTHFRHAESTYVEAIADALRTEMRLDPRVFVMGET